MKLLALLAMVAGCAHLSASAPTAADRIFVGYIPNGVPGAIVGQLHDVVSGAPLAGATVVAEAEGAGVTEAGITDANGAFRIYGLTPGRRHLTLYYADDSRDIGWIEIGTNAVMINAALAIDPEGPIADRNNDTLVNPRSTMQGLRVGGGSL